MIARVWRASVDAARVEDYERFAGERSTPFFLRQEGCRGVLMYRRGGLCTVITLWSGQEQADALSASAGYRDLVAGIRDQGFILDEALDGSFDVHEASIRP